MKTNQKNIKDWEISGRQRHLVEGAVVLALFAFLLLSFPFVFIANDDRILQEIVSGAFTGQAQGHMMFFSYPLSGLLAWCYRVFPGLPWYGLFQTVCMFAGTYLIFDQTARFARKLSSLLWVNLGLAVVFFLAFAKYIVMGTFTVTAGFLMVAAAIYFFATPVGLTPGRFLRHQIVTVVLAALSFCIRQNAMLMFLPAAGLFWLLKLYLEKDTTEYIRKYVCFAAALVGGIAVCYIWNGLEYGSDKWKEYLAFNEADARMRDYESGYPPYEGNEAVYEEMGISESLYVGMTQNYMRLFLQTDSEDMAKLAELAQRDTTDNVPAAARLGEVLLRLWKERTENRGYPNNRLVLLFYTAVIVTALLQKKYRALLPAAALWAGRFVAAFYLVFGGRFPHQVSAPFYMLELGMLLVIFVSCRLYEDFSGKLTKAAAVFGLVCVAVLAGRGIRSVYVQMGEEARSHDSYAEGLYALNAYCREHADSFYYVDNNSVNFFKQPYWRMEEGRYHNYIVMGGWIYGSPLVQQKLADKGIDDPEQALLDREDIYVVFNLHDSFSQEYLWKYLSGKYQMRYELVDTIEASPEVTFGVYSVTEEGMK